MRLAVSGFVFALALVATVGLSACGSEAEQPSAPRTGTHDVDGMTFPVPERESIRYGLASSGTVGYLPLIYAQDQNLFEKYGLDVDFLTFGSASQLAQAMVAGQIDAQDQTGGPVLASIPTPDPQEMVFVSRYNLTDILFAAEDTKTADDLRGKTVAVSSFGSQSYAGAIIALDALGLTTDDVTVTALGNDQARLAALRAGSVAASIQDGASLPTLASLGFHPLVKLADVEGKGVVRSAATTTVSFAEQYPNTVLALVAAYMEARATMGKDPEHLSELFAKDSDMPLDQATEQVKAALSEDWLPIDGSCPDKELAEFQKEVFGAGNPALAEVDAMAACTDEFVDRLREIGLQSALGID